MLKICVLPIYLKLVKSSFEYYVTPIDVFVLMRTQQVKLYPTIDGK